MLDLPTLNNSNNNKMNNNNSSHSNNSLNYHASYPNYHINPTPFLNHTKNGNNSNNNNNNNNNNNSQTQSTTSSLSTFQSTTTTNSLSSPPTDVSKKSSSTNHANLRVDIKNLNDHKSSSSSSSSSSHSSSSSSSSSTSTSSSSTARPISHATRIPQTNLSYKELLRKHQFTPSGGSSSTSPMKQSFETLNLNNNNNNNNKINNKLLTLESQIEAFKKKPIIEEPKKITTGYQLFGKWKKQERENGHSCPQWNELDQSQKDEWNKKSEQAKIQYHHEKEIWLKYVEEANRLVC